MRPNPETDSRETIATPVQVEAEGPKAVCELSLEEVRAALTSYLLQRAGKHATPKPGQPRFELNMRFPYPTSETVDEIIKLLFKNPEAP